MNGKRSEGASVVPASVEATDEVEVVSLIKVVSEAPGNGVASVSVDVDGESTGRFGTCGSMRAVVDDVSRLDVKFHGEGSWADAVDLRPMRERSVVRRRACLRMAAAVCIFWIEGEVWCRVDGRGYGIFEVLSGGGASAFVDGVRCGWRCGRRVAQSRSVSRCLLQLFRGEEK